MSKQSHYRYLHIFSMLFLMLMLCDAVTTYKFIRMPFGCAEACVFVIPLWFILGDIITEIYGKKIARNILFSAFVIEVIFSLLCNFLVYLPSPTFWKNEPSFELILGHLPRVVLSGAVAVLIAGNINIYCISKWKKMLAGRYFWIRSIAASWISEGIYSAIAVYFILRGVAPQHVILTAIFWSYISKILLTILFSTPAVVIATIVKARENISNESDFLNPFNIFMRT